MHEDRLRWSPSHSWHDGRCCWGARHAPRARSTRPSRKRSCASRSISPIAVLNPRQGREPDARCRVARKMAQTWVALEFVQVPATGASRRVGRRSDVTIASISSHRPRQGGDVATRTGRWRSSSWRRRASPSRRRPIWPVSGSASPADLESTVPKMGPRTNILVSTHHRDIQASCRTGRRGGDDSFAGKTMSTAIRQAHRKEAERDDGLLRADRATGDFELRQ